MAATEYRLCLPAAAATVAIHGSTIRNTAVELRMGIGPQRIVLAVRLAETRLLTDKVAPGNKLVSRAAICPAIGPVAPALATGPLGVAGTALEISECPRARVAPGVVGSVALVVVGPEPAANVAPPAWVHVAAVGAVAVVVGGGKQRCPRKNI
jgi:hypothetical protein